MKTRLIFLACLFPMLALAQQAEDDDMYFNSTDRKILASSKPTPKNYGSDLKDSGDEINPTDSYSGRGQNPQADSKGKQDAYFTPDYTPKGVNKNNQYSNNGHSYDNCCNSNYYNRYSPYNSGWGMNPYNSMYYSPSAAFWNSYYYNPYSYGGYGYDPYYSDPYYRNSYYNSMYYNSYYSNPAVYYQRNYVPQAVSPDRKKSTFDYDNPPAGVSRQRVEGNTNNGAANGRRAADTNSTNADGPPLRQRTYSNDRNDNNTQQSGWDGNRSSGSFGNSGGNNNNNGGFSGGSGGSGGGSRGSR